MAGDLTDSTTYWFAVLELSRSSGDYEMAAEAQRNLERLGVRVTYQQPVRCRQEVTG